MSRTPLETPFGKAFRTTRSQRAFTTSLAKGSYESLGNAARVSTTFSRTNSGDSSRRVEISNAWIGGFSLKVWDGVSMSQGFCFVFTTTRESSESSEATESDRRSRSTLRRDARAVFTRTAAGASDPEESEPCCLRRLSPPRVVVPAVLAVVVEREPGGLVVSWNLEGPSSSSSSRRPLLNMSRRLVKPVVRRSALRRASTTAALTRSGAPSVRRSRMASSAILFGGTPSRRALAVALRRATSAPSAARARECKAVSPLGVLRDSAAKSRSFAVRPRRAASGAASTRDVAASTRSRGDRASTSSTASSLTNFAGRLSTRDRSCDAIKAGGSFSTASSTADRATSSGLLLSSEDKSFTSKVFCWEEEGPGAHQTARGSGAALKVFRIQSAGVVVVVVVPPPPREGRTPVEKADDAVHGTARDAARASSSLPREFFFSSAASFSRCCCCCFSAR
mmetsp:Transcript_4969/g.16290  ORF Transcript_4969/g.16290 Transcript_4969/m.16290 type:complete len:452 (-) Transcript_4969:1202-2557(-)